MALSREDSSREVLEAIFGVGRALSLTVIAEGVEEARQLSILEGMGCERIQGFLLGRPSPAELIETLSGPGAARV